MKLRIDDSSIRFRIERDELRRLRDDGVVETVTGLPPTDGEPLDFRFALRIDPDRSDAAVERRTDGIVLSLTAAELETLERDDREGIYLDREWVDDEGTRKLRILVEKDRKAPGWDATEPWVGRRGVEGG